MSKNHLERSPKIYLSEIIFYIEKIELFTIHLWIRNFVVEEAESSRAELRRLRVFSPT